MITIYFWKNKKKINEKNLRNRNKVYSVNQNDHSILIKLFQNIFHILFLYYPFLEMLNIQKYELIFFVDKKMKFLKKKKQKKKEKKEKKERKTFIFLWSKWMKNRKITNWTRESMKKFTILTISTFSNHIIRT